MIKTLSDNVILPIAGLIITFVLCYELITAITEKNNMHDVDTFIFFKYVFKAAIAVYLLSHTFDITMAVFDVAQTVVTQAGGIITNETSIDIATTIAAMETEMEAMSIGGLVQLALETLIISLSLKIMSILITVILYGRMIEIYLTVSVSPIPFATMTNREWGKHRNQLFQNTFLPRIPGIFYDCMRSDLCSPGQQHDCCREYSFGAVQHCCLYGHPLYQSFQDRKPVQIPVRGALKYRVSVKSFLSPAFPSHKKGVDPHWHLSQYRKTLAGSNRKLLLILQDVSCSASGQRLPSVSPSIFFTKDPLGTSVSGVLMIFIMLPFFFLAMYEKDGLPFEQIFINFIRFCRSDQIRTYQTNNLYRQLEELPSADTGKEAAFEKKKKWKTR